MDKKHIREMVSTYMNKIDNLIDIYKKHKDDKYEMKKVYEKKEYSRMKVESRTWADRMYLYPIPQSELFCNTNLGPQNPGW